MDQSRGSRSPTPDFSALEEELFGTLTPPPSSASSSAHTPTHAAPSFVLSLPTLALPSAPATTASSNSTSNSNSTSVSTPPRSTPPVPAPSDPAPSDPAPYDLPSEPSRRQPQITLPSPPSSATLPFTPLTPEEAANVRTNVSLLKSHLISNHTLHLHNLSLLSTHQSLSQHLANEHALRISSETSLQDEVARLKEELEKEKGVKKATESERDVLRERLKVYESGYTAVTAQMEEMKERLAEVRREKDVLEGVIRGYKTKPEGANSRPKTAEKEDSSRELIVITDTKADGKSVESLDPPPEARNTELIPQSQQEPISLAGIYCLINVNVPNSCHVRLQT
ncbi:hypothetical protein RUND412_000441 [Rhizina undulata]